MSVYWFAWGIARAAAPLIGGFLNDSIEPRAIWVGGLGIGLASAVGLFIFYRFRSSADNLELLENSTIQSHIFLSGLD
jgi:MFS family permease